VTFATKLLVGEGVVAESNRRFKGEPEKRGGKGACHRAGKGGKEKRDNF